MAETINGLYKTEVIRRRASWRTMDEVEIETLKWVNWFNHRRLPGPIGNIPPAEAAKAFHADLTKLDTRNTDQQVSGKPGACVDAPGFAS